MNDVKVLRMSESNFNNILTGFKTFEIREKRLGIKQGEVLNIVEYDSRNNETYRFAVAEVGYIQEIENMVVMSIEFVKFIDGEGVLHHLDH